MILEILQKSGKPGFSDEDGIYLKEDRKFIV